MKRVSKEERNRQWAVRQYSAAKDAIREANGGTLKGLEPWIEKIEQLVNFNQRYRRHEYVTRMSENLMRDIAEANTPELVIEALRRAAASDSAALD